MSARHTLRPKTWRATWGAMMGVSTLRQMRLGCSFIPRSEPNNWFAVVDDPRRSTITQFELSQGLEQARTEYNLAYVELARRTRRTQIGHRAGFADLFVPVVDDQSVEGVLVCGPILDQQPSADALKREWQQISGALVDPDDETFLRYVRSVLDSHVFEGRSFEMLVSHVQGLASAMAGTSLRPAKRDMRSWLALRSRVPEVSMWDVASELVDPHTNARWIASYRGTDRSLLGIARMPNYVVTVAPFFRDAAMLDAAELMLRTHVFQRTCAALASELPNTIAGRLGAEAAFFLTHIATERKDRARSRLVALGERLRRLIRQKLDTDVVCGFSSLAVHGGELPVRYDEAMWAVLWGLHKNEALTFHADTGQKSASPTAGLYRSSRVLCESFARGGRRETAVAAQRVVKDVLWISSGSLEVMRSHFLQILWELLALIEQRDIVDKRTSTEMEMGFTAQLKKARATHEVTNSFTELVSELQGAL
ncbi:MAG TPA: hypothetical protein VGP93_04570, partial [Polyangiaceae bacterium]|nr:hypothetical protein [Polyangiaceae bacterium]